MRFLCVKSRVFFVGVAIISAIYIFEEILYQSIKQILFQTPAFNTNCYYIVKSHINDDLVEWFRVSILCPLFISTIYYIIEIERHEKRVPHFLVRRNTYAWFWLINVRSFKELSNLLVLFRLPKTQNSLGTQERNHNDWIVMIFISSSKTVSVSTQ